jgi:hypothetical protein
MKHGLHGVVFSIATLVAGCAADSEEPVDGRDDAFLTAGKADVAIFTEDEALGILEAANTLTFAELDDVVGLDRRAAEGIVAVRSGADGVLGTADDARFATLQQLDDVPFVGVVAVQKLLAYAAAHDLLMPDFLDVDLVGAVIGLGLANHEQWDFTGAVSGDLERLLVEALLGDSPFADVVALLATAAARALAAPDPFGTATLLGGPTVRLGDTATNTEDTFQPIFHGTPRFTRVAYEAQPRIRVTLQDEDLFLHDDIGVVEITQRDLRNAYRAGNVYAVPVADQSAAQLLFIRISVRAH